VMPVLPKGDALTVLSGATGKIILPIELPPDEFEGGSQFLGVGVLEGTEAQKSPSVVLFEEDVNDRFAVSVSAFSADHGQLRWRRVVFTPDESVSLIRGRFVRENSGGATAREQAIVGVFARLNEAGFTLNGVTCLSIWSKSGVEKWRAKLPGFEEPGHSVIFVRDRDEDGLPDFVVSTFRDHKLADERSESMRQFFGGAVFVVGSSGKVLQRIDR